MDDIKGKTVLITGASSGIGAACARTFGESGARLVLVARRRDRLKKLPVSDACPGCFTYGLDVRDRAATDRFLRELPPEFGRIDILVNNAGLARGFDPVQTGRFEDWDEMIDTNLKGLLNITRAVLPGMISRGSGHIINIGSIAGRYAYPNGAVYCATKFAVRALTQGLLMELVGTPVRVTTVDPGLVETEFSLVRFRGDEERAGEIYRRITPLTGADIAEAVLFAASRPPHVNISELVILPTNQASPFHIHRAEGG